MVRVLLNLTARVKQCQCANNIIDAAFYEAQAVVLSNMGQHRQSLEIYVFKMKDYVKAEEYVARTLYRYLSGL